MINNIFVLHLIKLWEVVMAHNLIITWKYSLCWQLLLLLHSRDHVFFLITFPCIDTLLYINWMSTTDIFILFLKKNWFHHNPPTVHDPPSFPSDLNAVHPYLSQLRCSIRALHGCPTESPLLQLRHLVIVSAFCSRQQESEMECTLSL